MVLERARLRPGAIAEALAGWARFVRGPVRALDDYTPEDCTCPGCRWDDPVVRREALRLALFALPAKASRELRALVEPLDEVYLSRSIPQPEMAYLRTLLTEKPLGDHFRPWAADTFTCALDLVGTGWLLAVLGDSRGERRLYASYLTPALRDMLAALLLLTTGERSVRVSWDGEPIEYRWLITTDPSGHAHVRVLAVDWARPLGLPGNDGHELLTADLPLHELVRTVAGAARALLTRFGEDEYAERWARGPFPADELLALERWLRGSLDRARNGGVAIR
ncbi:hypothetical protein [Amycolatopsis sp. NPDC058986]|uniref:hypothetical protein n=1 Tax=Amycolatopsis sp. NPDC058986 TaxID=3346685 RepID=UPI00366D5973